MPSDGFTDPAEFFGTIFGGEAFIDLIGEISLMKDLTRTMDITKPIDGDEEKNSPAGEETTIEESLKEDKTHTATGTASTVQAKESCAEDPVVVAPSVAEASEAKSSTATTLDGNTGSSAHTNGASTSRKTPGIPTRLAIMDKSDEDNSCANATDEDKDLRKKDKKKIGLSKAQKEELAAYEKERIRVRQERVTTLAKKLVDRLSIWTETDKSAELTIAFQEKTRLEVENLKMESFGLDILHAIGATYIQKATAVLKSQKFLGIGGFLSKLKDKGTLAKETWNTISSAIDAQITMEEMAKLEEKGGEDWTNEKKVEYERRVTGKILTAAWKGSKFEIQGVLRDVCDEVLNDKNISSSKRIERAKALVICGDIFQKVNLFSCMFFFGLFFFSINSFFMKIQLIFTIIGSAQPR